MDWMGTWQQYTRSKAKYLYYENEMLCEINLGKLLEKSLKWNLYGF